MPFQGPISWPKWQNYWTVPWFKGVQIAHPALGNLFQSRHLRRKNWERTLFRRIAEQFIFITLFQEENDKNMECVKIIGLVLLDTIIVGGFRNSLVKIGHKAHPASRILDTTVWERVGNDVLVLALIGEATADMCYEGRRAQGGSELDRPDQFLLRRSRAGTCRRPWKSSTYVRFSFPHTYPGRNKIG